MQIDLNDILEIFLHSHPETVFFYNPEDEEIHQLLQDEVDGVYDPDFAQEILSNPERYIQLPQLTDDIRYEFMSGFVDSLPETRARHMLLDALDDSCAYERFDEFASGLGLEDSWNAYFLDHCEQYIQETCAEEHPELKFV